ncbi:hypothetical protein CAPTEDRAFT_206900 [Capitella teleta]|uniref:CARD domain-containing protein n=1 Tax=Capitella teleta TaxID=283909 RepID=R7UMV9_CAPTE|nr:hypothetical protein CAPTEDRAFT_206900 [Capitella teleta]|eukprot:ELU05272.1 hypothetical protein CAPTEDRAFT_206900 [Capitella teleta]
MSAADFPGKYARLRRKLVKTIAECRCFNEYSLRFRVKYTDISPSVYENIQTAFCLTGTMFDNIKRNTGNIITHFRKTQDDHNYVQDLVHPEYAMHHEMMIELGHVIDLYEDVGLQYLQWQTYFIWPLKMDSSHKKCLLRNRIFLLNEISLSVDLLGNLSAESVITDEHHEKLENIQRNDTTKAAVLYLIAEILPKRGPEAFNKFLEALRDSEQDHVADQLLDWLKTN